MCRASRWGRVASTARRSARSPLGIPSACILGPVRRRVGRSRGGRTGIAALHDLTADRVLVAEVWSAGVLGGFLVVVLAPGLVACVVCQLERGMLGEFAVRAPTTECAVVDHGGSVEQLAPLVARLYLDHDARPE